MIDAASSASAIIALLGGTAFRLVIGHVISLIENYQEFKFEQGRIKLQNELETNQIQRQIELLKAQKEVGVSVVNVEKEYAQQQIDQDHYNTIFNKLLQPTGFQTLDFLNSAVRPLLAIICIVVWLISLAGRNWVLSTWDLELIGATLGLFIGSRISSTGK